MIIENCWMMGITIKISIYNDERIIMCENISQN